MWKPIKKYKKHKKHAQEQLTELNFNVLYKVAFLVLRFKNLGPRL